MPISRLALTFALASALSAPTWAQQGALNQNAEFQAALRAMQAGIPSIAKVKTARLLQSANWTAEETSTLTELQLEACLRSRDFQALAKILASSNIADAAYWRGVSLLEQKAYGDALAELDECKPDSPKYALSRLAAAHAFAGMGRNANARRAVKDLRDHPDKNIASQARMIFNELELSVDRAQLVLDRLSREEVGKDARVQYLRARAHYQLGANDKAEAILRDILGTDGIGEHAHDAATVLLSQVLAKTDRKSARELLVGFLNTFTSATTEASPDSDFWSEGFATLESLATEPLEIQTVLPPVLVWAGDATLQSRQGYALHLVARLLHILGRDEEAVGFLESFISLYPNHPRSGDAIRLAMQIHGNNHADERVLSLADIWKRDFGGGGESVVDFLSGMIRFTRGEYGEAASLFAKAAELDSELNRRKRALYNGAVAALKAGETAVFTALLAQLQQAGETSSGAESGKPSATDISAADLKLDAALALAGKGQQSQAEGDLDAFVKDKANAQHPRLASAYLALAEIRLLDQPPRTETAELALQEAAAAANSDETQQRIDYMRIWLNEAKDQKPGVVNECLHFIQKWPMGEKAAEVHMKLAETYYRDQNFAAARTYFELVPKNWPESAFAETAQYFAGKSALAIGNPESVNAAISLWEQLAESHGPLAFEARVQQAAAKRLQGNHAEALKLLDVLLTEAPEDRKPGLFCDKAEILLNLATKDPANYKATTDLLSSPTLPKNLSFVWKARVNYLRARAYKAQKLSDLALEACYETVEAGADPENPAATPSEFEWLYRAGFLAIDYLEEQKQWEAAAQLADRLAKTAAPLAKEAASKASRIRLQHYLWDGKK